MIKIILKPKFKFKYEMNLKNLSKINFEKKMLLKTKILYANKEFMLNKLFHVTIQENKGVENELVIHGLNKNCDYLGWKWSNGLLRVKSDVGSFLGVNMSDGQILIDGSAENFVGSKMFGGKIIVHSNVRNFVGASLPGEKIGMAGGEIIIKGNASDFLGFNLRRGTILVKGDVGNHPCHNMIAGTVILGKNFGDNLGFGMKRGTIFVSQETPYFSNFVKSGEIKTSFYNLLNIYFIKDFGFKIFEKNQKLIRFFGDVSFNGMGEILVKK